MVAWALAAGIGAVLAVVPGGAAVARRRRGEAEPVPLRPADVGLDDFPAGGTLVQFSQPTAVSSRVALNRLAAAVAHSDGPAVVVELPLEQRSALARRLAVHAAPTILLVGGDGVVRWRWNGPPPREELAAALGGYEPVAAASR